ncbi:hypothetical protein TK49_04060 [Ralstonia mannitolilytica]|nr:hypothetical protein TK49_04060 [Ralstonia mannitolilytica]
MRVKLESILQRRNACLHQLHAGNTLLRHASVNGRQTAIGVVRHAEPHPNLVCRAEMEQAAAVLPWDRWDTDTRREQRFQLRTASPASPGCVRRLMTEQPSAVIAIEPCPNRVESTSERRPSRIGMRCLVGEPLLTMNLDVGA